MVVFYILFYFVLEIIRGRLFKFSGDIVKKKMYLFYGIRELLEYEFLFC